MAEFRTAWSTEVAHCRVSTLNTEEHVVEVVILDQVVWSRTFSNPAKMHEEIERTRQLFADEPKRSA